MNAKKRALIAASVAGLIAAGTAAVVHPVQAADEGKVPCYGVNKCKGTGDCGGKGHGCAGKNECGGQGYINLAKDDCLRIKDGSLTPPAEG